VVQVVGKANTVEGHTHTVSASGAMLIIPEPLPEGTMVTIENLKAQTKVEARVVRPPQMGHDGSLVPVEFTSPSPNFWGIFFPPAAN
jgi:PilZ domain-containing protein